VFASNTADVTYLDHDTAENFARVLPFVLSDRIIPKGNMVLDSIPFPLLLDLQEAGLIQATGSLHYSIAQPVGYLEWGMRVIRIECEGPGWRTGGKHGVSAYPLTAAGRELARVAHVDRVPEVWTGIAAWLPGEFPPNARISIAGAHSVL